MRVELPCRPRRDARSGGFTLLEVLIGFIIVSIGISLFIASNRTAAFGNERADIYGKAANATLEAAEAVRLMSLPEVGRLAMKEIAHTQGRAIKVTATGRRLTGADVVNLDILDTASLRHLTLQTLFKGAGGREVVKTFTTIIYKPE